METNQIPKMNIDPKETGCCPNFNPEGWDGETINFDNKLFVKVRTKNIFYIPMNMGPVLKRICDKVFSLDGFSKEYYLIMSHANSPWSEDHMLAVEKEIEGEEIVRLSGTFITKVFEGKYSEMNKWMKEMEEFVKEKGKEAKKIYSFYTTCPKCAKHHGKNYVVLFAEV